MPFSDFAARLQALGVNPFVPNGISGSGPSFRTPSFFPTTTAAGGPASSGAAIPRGGAGGVPMGGGLFSRALGGLFPVSDGGGLITPEQQQAAQRQGLLSFGASLLANSGPQPGPGIGLGAALGQALQAGQGAAQGGIQNQLQELLLRSKIAENMRGSRQSPFGQIDTGKFTPESLQKFAQSGNYADLVPVTVTSTDDGIGNVNPGQYDPDSVEAFKRSRTKENPLGDFSLLKPYVAPAQPQIVDANGVPNVVLPSRTGGAPILQPLTTQAQQNAAAAELARFKKLGELAGQTDAERQKKGINALTVLDQLELADPLIDVATGSGPGAAADKLLAFFGEATDGDRAIRQLKVLQAGLITSMPRLEGPQSDRDAQLYREAAGEIGDPTVPREAKKDAVAVIRRIQRQYAQLAPEAGAPLAPVGQQGGGGNAPGSKAKPATSIKSFYK